MPPTAQAVRSVREMAAVALRLESGLRVEAAPQRSGLTADDLEAAVVRHRLGDLLEPHAAEVGLPRDVAERLGERRRKEHLWTMRQMLELRRMSDLMAGLDWLSIKGPALAVQTTGDPTARGPGDLDVFVHPDDVERAVERIVRHGWRPRTVGSATPGTWAWRYLLWNYNEMTFDGPHSTVDLHWRLDPSAAALPSFAASWSRRVLVPVGDVTVHTLGPRDAFSHACRHAEKDGWRWLRNLVDVHRLARRDDVWSSLHEVPLEPPDLRALTVTAACVGLPTTVPQHLVREDAGSARLIHRAFAAQESRLVDPNPRPGAASGQYIRYRLSVSRRGTDVARALSAYVLPVEVVHDVDDRSAWTGLPRALRRRATSLVRRLMRWARWEPGAHADLSARK
jgi:hypothetical protein